MIKIISLPALLWVIFSSVSANEFPPVPGQRHDIGGYQLHIHCLGTGSPTIIIDTGLGDDSSDWQSIVEQSSLTTQTCVYDRPGYGWSDYGPRPRDSERIAFELALLLQRAKIQPPYILVGHSFGGYNIRMFAASYPNKVAGLVLIDASHENQYTQLNIKIPKNNRRIHSRITQPRTNLNLISTIQKNQLLRDKAFHTVRYEIYSLYQSSQQVAHITSIPIVPLIVISRGIAEWFGNDKARQREKTWIKLQQDLTYLSPISQHIFANRSGHNIHQQQPEIIVDALSDVTHLARLMSSP
ncbi:alpha/beta hydrolase [Methylophaga sp. 42_8_T64]|nr:alpha/beta hydrolase [Methylophaga sp. 41_12_T18]OUR86917.1 alpha/beta hydrolase [Methylophaga sp. 42_8_T64]